MSFADIDEVLVARFKAQITLGGDGGAAIATVYPNSNQAEPSSGTWARVYNVSNERRQADFGSTVKTIREIGRFVCELYATVDKGPKELLALADRVAAAFDCQEFPPVVCDAANRNLPGDVRATGTWARLVVTVPWYADTVG